MSKPLTSVDLIKSIKRRAMIPSDQNTFTDQDFLDMLNEEILYFGAPHLLRTHEEYLLVSEDFALDGSREYQIPHRSLGNKLRELAYVTNVDNTTASFDEQVYELSRISVDDLPDYNNYSSSRYTNTFYLQGNKIILLGEFALTDAVLRMHYYLRPNCLVKENKVATINSIDTATGTIVLNSFPDGFAGSPEMDFVQFKAANQVLAFDKQPTSVDSNTKTVIFAPADLPSELIAGDYLTVAQETIVPQLPVELHAVLAQRVAIAALESLGDEQGKQSAERQLEKMEKATTDIIDNRVEGAPEKINNRHGALREATLNSRFRGK